MGREVPAASAEEALAASFGDYAELVRGHAERRPAHPAIVHGERSISYGELDAAMDRIAATLQARGVAPRQAVANCAAKSIE
jgi:long-chain acyl-CoA synthetase